MLLLFAACSDYGVARQVEVQSWTQPARAGGVDIVWVIDDSSSMLEEQEQLAAHADSFISFLNLEQFHSKWATIQTTRTRAGPPQTPLPGGS